MLTYKEFRKKLLTELEQRGIKFEITSMTSVNGEKERISIAFSNFTTDNAVDSDINLKHLVFTRITNMQIILACVKVNLNHR